MDWFGSSGARGPVADELTPSVVLDIVRSAVAHWGTDRVAIGRDVRVTGPALAAAAESGAMAAGADVADLGLAPTPAVQAYAERETIPAVVITASHNPPPDNGVKLIADDGGELSITDYEAVEARMGNETAVQAAWDDFGNRERVEGATTRYVDELIERLDRSTIAEAGVRVVVDAGTGAGGQTSPELCRRLGCSVQTLNAQFDGTFPARPSEPTPDALEDLADAVERTDADLGVAHDGDADRAMFVDERGRVVGGGAMLSALAVAVAGPGDTIVAAISAPSSLARAAEAAGAELELTPVGAANVLTRVRELEAEGRTVVLAGEQNGGIILPQYRLARDGAYTLGRVLELVARRPLSELVEPHAGQAFRRRDIHGVGASAIDRVREWAASQEGLVTEVDGVRLDLDDRWVLARESGTEPLVRVYAEAPSADGAEALLDAVAAAIETD